ncbi:hypothetical protein DLM85_20485 [Hymenobacter edaphi]|uniref:Uncharacterized protein n=1 Tax=Hymenobacter edaphi TaxID=2211146 RepID=A0A328BDJ3_9BACT|nr:hypothetical protein DLM85_20485 [Hymenobacter edaphi]
MLVVLCLSASYARAQAGLIVAAVRAATNVVSIATADRQFARKGKGTYQLSANGQWQTAPLLLTGEGLRAGSGKTEQTYPLGEVRQVAFGRDTFAVVQAVQFPPPADAKAAALAPPDAIVGYRVWRHPQVELLEFSSTAGPVTVLRFPNQVALALPTERTAFQQTMLTVIGDHPKLGPQLRNGQYDPIHTRALLEYYLRDNPAGFALITNSGAAPAH